MNRSSNLEGSALRCRAGVGLGVILCAWLSLPAHGALTTITSENLSGFPAPEIQAETLDGQAFTRPAGAGKAVCISFFASWCPVCQAENQELREIQATYAGRGLEFIGVLVDSVETPDTLEEARQGLKRKPLPYPVILMNESLKAPFQYIGFPATYFIGANGAFTTTLYGYHPRGKITEIAERVLLGGSTGGGTASAERGSAISLTGSPVPPVQPAPWSRSPLLALVPGTRKQIHPLIVHFPIAFLGLELIFVMSCLVWPRDSLELFSRWLLWCAAVSLVPSIYSGLSDVGADLGPGWGFWNGLQDRLHHFTRLESTVSLHVLFVLLTAFLVLTRLAWRGFLGGKALEGWKRIVFAVLTLLGFWTLFAAGQVGGSISHP